MKKNVGNSDKIIRIVLGLVFIGLFFAGVLPTTIGYVLLVLAGIFIITSLVGTCPIYSILGLSTCPVKSKS